MVLKQFGLYYEFSSQLLEVLLSFGLLGQHLAKNVLGYASMVMEHH